MKLVATALAAVQAGSPAFREVKQLYENFQVCGSVHGTVGQNTTFTDSHELAPGETCVYRIKGDGEHPIEIVDFDFDIDCADGEVYFVTDDQMIGPFCNDDHIKRRRRNAYGHSHNDMQGQSFKSKEMDMVIGNGQRARFRFGFNFEFELLPGLPMAGGSGGQCAFKGIKGANAAFYAQYSDNDDANAIFAKLTESMYKFNCYWDRYRDQCKGNGPTTVACHLMDFSDNTHKPIVDKIEAIIDAQCAQCRGGAGAVCTEWYLLLAQLKYACKGHTDPVTPDPCGPDECYENPCGDNAVCTNTCESYTCTCADGYSGDGYECCDANQCEDGNNGGCGANAECIDQCVGNTCSCKDGFKLEYGECVPECDKNQCDENPCDANAECVDKCKGYECKCKDGYSGDGYKCCDANQCDGNHDCKGNTVCVDKCIGYKCECKAGYGGANCCDEDQCAKNNGDCGEYATCHDKCSGYECKCIKGYSMKNGKCVKDCDENQCANKTHDCHAHATCIDKCSGFECKCNDGYYGGGQVCCDEKQCDSNPCGENTRCVEKCEGYQCVCKDNNYRPVTGYGGTGVLNCEHKDKCYGVKCGKNMECRDGLCYCKKGYYQDGEYGCKPKINECITGQNNCHKYATCEDTLTSFKCTCNEGYSDVDGDGTNCVHPYYLDTGMCYLNQYSSFTDKKFEKIAFKTAYGVQEAIAAWETITAELTQLGEKAMGDRTIMCDDDAGYIGCGFIDYTEDETACDWAHSLEAVVAEVQKKCNKGWQDKFGLYFEQLRKNSCDEPDDCADNKHNCNKNAECVPKDAVYGKKTSGYNCICKKGYYGNGISCYPEVNECELNKHRCNEYADCVDKSAGYDCKCQDGYVGNGYKCQVPVNECELKTHDCHEYAYCTDLKNGYMCTCKVKEGYTGDGRHCTGPADECADGTNLCHEFATCTNTYAGYTCKCKDGYTGNGKQCYPPLVCPWASSYSGNYGGATGYAGDYGEANPGFCSLKYSKVCWESVSSALFASGAKICNKKNAYSQFALLLNELFNLGKLYDKKYHKATAHYPGPGAERYGSDCDAKAGAVPCNLIDFHNIETAADLYAKVEALVTHVFGQCSAEYNAKWQHWLARYYNALICPVNECKEGTYECNEYATCVDKAKGYDCVCNKHYVGDGYKTCEVIDYCSRNDVCNEYANCVAGEYGVGYTCECKTGYSGPKCLPDDPCKTNNGGCHEHAVCTSRFIGYEVNHTCKCKTGWYGNGKICDKIDPCAYHNCGDNADCIPNAVVSDENDYECKCREGYAGNGFYCEVYVSPCDGVQCNEGAECTVTTSKYGHQDAICKCAKGYTGDGKNCRPLGPCEDNNCHRDAECVANGSLYSMGFKCVCKDGLEGDGVTKCGASDPCDECHAYAKCVSMPGYSGAPVKQCVCNAPYIGDGINCRVGKKCTMNCPTGSVCWDGQCNCKNRYTWYDWGSKTCKDRNECKKKENNNCHDNATCTNKISAGYVCSCNPGYVGDGITCHKKEGGETYADGGNPYVTGDQTSDKPDQVKASTFYGVDGTNTELFANFGDGTCSIMGYNWVVVESTVDKMQWLSNAVKAANIKAVRDMFTEFQSLGKAVLARQAPQCDRTKAGRIDCSLLYFPKTEHRCQLMQRIEKVYNAVADHCNPSWKQKFGGMMDKLLADNKKYKKGLPCPEVVFL